jgi:hypothetical protein
VLNPDLFFANSREMLVCWERMRPILPEIRAAFQDSRFLANLEQAGKAFEEWISKNSGPEAYKAFVARVVG